ncbi:UNVERIFIED_ORG: hypothetical protein QE434_002494 [Rhizobium sp. SORGH_AS 755]|nr:hypothetical protein [Rhizobium sp. SORGH_AS_0755]
MFPANTRMHKFGPFAFPLRNRYLANSAGLPPSLASASMVQIT